MSSLAWGCRSGPAQRVEEPDTPHWRYTARLEPPGEILTVRLCFDGAPSGTLIPGRPEGRALVDRAIIVATGARLRSSAQGFALDGVGDGDCVRYSVHLDRVLDERGVMVGVRLTPNHAVLRTSVWLWRPHRWPSGVRASLNFETPPAVTVSVPWPEEHREGAEHQYRLPRSAFRWLSVAVLGEVRRHRFEEGGTNVDAVVLGELPHVDEAGVRTWIGTALRRAQTIAGVDPPKTLQVVVQPTAGTDFGLAGRGGGPSVLLFVPSNATIEALQAGWTTTHEVLHHSLPFIEEAWMAEGWASYYTELTRTRAGHRTEREGWQALYDAFVRGQRTSVGRMTLAAASRTMHRHHGYQRVYWGGAAIAFLMDVELRMTSDRTLDDAVAHLSRCCGPTTGKHGADALLEELDRWYGAPMFSRIAREHLENTTFPPFEAALSALGVVVHDGSIRLDDEHAGAPIRRALMGGSGLALQ